MVMKIFQANKLTVRLEQILKEVSDGHIALIEGPGNHQAVLLDFTDFQILIAFVHSFNPSPRFSVGSDAVDSTQVSYNHAISAYLAGEIDLAETSNQLNLSWIDLLQRFSHLGIPLQEDSFDLDDSIEELRAIRYRNFRNWV